MDQSPSAVEMIAPGTPVLYHVTTQESAEGLQSDGYKMRDWTRTYEAWNLSLDFESDDWEVPDYVDSSLVGVALAERLFEEGRLDGHPSRAQAGFFYTNPWTARAKMRTADFGNVCIVVDPLRLDGPIAVGRGSQVGRVFSLVMDAVEYSRPPLKPLETLQQWVSEYWFSVREWAGNQHPRVEVFVPESTGVPAESILGCVREPDQLASVGERDGLKRYE